MRVSRLLYYFVDRNARLFDALLTSLHIGTLSPSIGIKDTQEYVIWSIRYELNDISESLLVTMSPHSIRVAKFSL